MSSFNEKQVKQSRQSYATREEYLVALKAAQDRDYEVDDTPMIEVFDSVRQPDGSIKLVPWTPPSEKPNRSFLPWVFLLSGIIWGMCGFSIPFFERNAPQATPPSIQSPR